MLRARASTRETWLFASLLAALLLPTEAGGQIPQFTEGVDVRVVNVDVVVTEGAGLEVKGLQIGDFELLLDGEPVAIDYFSAVEGGRITGSSAATTEAPGAAATADPRHYLAIVCDGRSLRSGELDRSLAELRQELDALVMETRGVMVMRQGRRLTIEETATRDRDRLDSALAGLSEGWQPVTDRSGRAMLMRQLETADPPLPLTPGGEDIRTQEVAGRLLREIKSSATIERHESTAAIGQLRSLVHNLAGLPGRKSVLYLSAGINTRPGEPLFRAWWAKYREIAPQVGVLSIEAEIRAQEVTNDLLDLTADARAHQISFYTQDPTGPRGAGGSAEFSSLDATRFTDRQAASSQQALLDLGVGTGGLGNINTSSLQPLMAEMRAGLRTYYSLGFQLDESQEKPRQVDVRLKAGGLRLRHYRRVPGRRMVPDLDQATLSALLTDVTENPLEARVEVGDEESQKDGTIVIPITVKVPMARLALLPKGSAHQGHLSVVLVARSASGELSDPSHGELPIEIENRGILKAMSGLAAYRMKVRLAPGEQMLAIGLRDDVAGRISTLNLILEPGAES